MYCVNQITEEAGLDLQACVHPATPYVFTGLQVGIQYTFIMYAINCKFQKGNDTDTLLIQLKGNAYMSCSQISFMHHISSTNL